MAAKPQAVDSLEDIRHLVWGRNSKQDIFQRWLQGFTFSPDEPNALVQFQGGPCGVIAPVEAYIIKFLIREKEEKDWSQAQVGYNQKLLIKALVNILKLASPSGPYWYVLHLSNAKNKDVSQEGQAVSHTNDPDGESASKRPCLENENFHSQLKVQKLENPEDLANFLESNLSMIQGPTGVLTFLYSVILTKGIEKLMAELEDLSEPLIDINYGHGNQSLINLMITGEAISHVWDNDRDVGGLKLRGITQRSQIGFLSLLEHLRYCEVGSFLKNPLNPIWMLGSETHLTVLFSPCLSLVSEDTPADVAKRIFRKYDPDGNKFISAACLQDVMSECNLVAEPEYVDIMKQKLDSESLGIILMNDFMEEFYPNKEYKPPETFTVFHYNGLRQPKVMFDKAHVVLLECHLSCTLESDPMRTCLQTKWPNIELQWDTGSLPSLN